jgi:hypothetical protein
MVLLVSAAQRMRVSPLRCAVLGLFAFVPRPWRLSRTAKG